MFRLANEAFIENEELHNLATYCLTETIKSHLELFFENDYENVKEQELYLKVKLDKALELLPNKLLQEMERVGVNISTFIPKKFAQFMLLLSKKEEETPDLLLEYILYRMIYKQSEKRVDFIPDNVSNKVPELKKLLRLYAKEMCDMEDVRERNQYVKEQVSLLTKFTCLFGSDDFDSESLTFWDWDFTFFDEWGFKEVLGESSNGILEQRGYGQKYTQSMFTDVGEEAPNFLK